MTSIHHHRGFCIALGLTALGLAALGCSSKADDDTSSNGGTASSTAGTMSSTAGTGVAAGGTSSSAGTSSTSAGTSSSTAGTSSSGGTGDSGGTCGPTPDECTGAAALMTMPISDFEAGKGWYLFANVDDKGGKTTPAAGDNIMAEEIKCPAGGRCGMSSFAQHVSGGGFTSYGPSLSQDFLYKDSKTEMVVGMPMDASMYTGVMFWARKGDTAGAAPTLRLIVNDVSTHELGGVCDPKAAPGSGGEMSDACWDGWMTERALPSTWTLVKVPFSVLKQGGFGKKGEKIQPDKLYGLTFQMPNMATFDFWIDDVAFYKE
ncbi:MAG TPA: hypothetical protein VHB79_07775 [Polyangiaceae bacterium]|nr:hypothetical protein [Polyangiaceae bacterium]